MSKMRIEIWSDIACPYCYIGLKKLEKALENIKATDKVEFVLNAYELDPTLPNTPSKQSFYEYFASKYGLSIEEAKEKQQGVIDLAKEVGLNYDYENLVIVNTNNALRLMKFASKHQVGIQVEEALFKAYFEEGKNINDLDLLLKIAKDANLNAEEVKAMLNSDDLKERIKKDIERAENTFNLQYIPFYRLNFNQIIQGAITLEQYEDVLKQALKDFESGTNSDGGSISGKACSVDGVCS